MTRCHRQLFAQKLLDNTWCLMQVSPTPEFLVPQPLVPGPRLPTCFRASRSA